jgi:hypothetical protein
MNNNISGYWVGSLQGTNVGGVVATLQQKGTVVSGTIKINDPNFGLYTYHVTGKVGTDIRLTGRPDPRDKNEFISIGRASIVAHFTSPGRVSGMWRTSGGTEGMFQLQKMDEPRLPSENSVFIVHGHDDAPLHKVARLLAKFSLSVAVLREKVNRGMTLIEKFENFAAKAGFAVVILSPDDVGGLRGKDSETRPRARQNVILELGYFLASLGRSRVFVLSTGDVELPSDFVGVVYHPYDEAGGWQLVLARELKSAGYSVDLNLLTP